ncbi:MAG: hypothetical protein BroJett042_12900 [Bacteroidota bacterium]|nr:MAG: hypothetical protein BroJett042_12900 [Bacteroidota bacterium]HNR74815.1 hypothetical protein [Cyclobacteriaceae bacterium]HNU42067.1 hypothetical protein [Cyclobacteriaceae bacterium]
MIGWSSLKNLPLEKKITLLYEHAAFVMAIRYYKYKINLYLLGSDYIEVFVNHKHASIDKISLLDPNHSRMKFYSDQIKLPEIKNPG